jgi:hypothetical protein
MSKVDQSSFQVPHLFSLGSRRCASGCRNSPALVGGVAWPFFCWVAVGGDAGCPASTAGGAYGDAHLVWALGLWGFGADGQVDCLGRARCRGLADSPLGSWMELGGLFGRRVSSLEGELDVLCKNHSCCGRKGWEWQLLA